MSAMSRIDRAVRHACHHHLAPDEALIASALGTEAEGRRRQVVLVTDKRVLIAGLRAHPPIALPRQGCTAGFDPTGNVLTLANGGQEVVLRDVDVDTAGRMARLLEWHRPVPEKLGRTATVHVRVLQD